MEGVGNSHKESYHAYVLDNTVMLLWGHGIGIPR